MADISVGILLVGRMSSSRLKHKLLLEVCGLPLIQHTAERLLRATKCKAVVMCTTTNISDDVLANRWAGTSVRVFRGDPEDPFRRMLACAEKFGFSHFIYAGADDVLLDPDLCDMLALRVASTRPDMTLVKGIVCGFTPYLFSTIAARRLVQTVKGNITIPEKYMKDLDDFVVDEVSPEGYEYLARPDIRATLDYGVDFEFFNTIISKLYTENPRYTNHDVMDFLAVNEEIVQINRAKHAEWIEKQNKEYGM